MGQKFSELSKPENKLGFKIRNAFRRLAGKPEFTYLDQVQENKNNPGIGIRIQNAFRKVMGKPTYLPGAKEYTSQERYDALSMIDDKIYNCMLQYPDLFREEKKSDFEKAIEVPSTKIQKINSNGEIQKINSKEEIQKGLTSSDLINKSGEKGNIMKKQIDDGVEFDD